MSDTEINILAFAGSTRKDSFNKNLIRNLISNITHKKANITFIDLKEYPMPIYDGDYEMENGLPENAKKLREIMIKQDAFFIASPEYNSGVSGLLKNFIDWTSRPEAGLPPYACYKDKVALILSASPSGLGGLRGLVQLRSILTNIGMIVLPYQLTLREAHKAFNENGELTIENKASELKEITNKAIEFTSKIKELDYNKPGLT